MLRVLLLWVSGREHGRCCRVRTSGNNAGNCLISWTENITLDTGYTNLVGLIEDSDNALYVREQGAR
jgi:hypothetical protein